MASKDCLTFSLLTWNTLANSYSSSKSFPYCSKNNLLWTSHRRHLIFSKLSSLNCDIYLLQEVDEIKDYKQYFEKNNYNVSFCKRTNHKIDGCLIAFKSNLFELITPIYIINYNDFSKRCDNEYDKTAFSKDNIAMIAVLRHKHFLNSPIIIGNTHLHWDPNLNKVKLWQTASFLNAIQWIITKHSLNHNYHIIFGGDFNSMPHSDVYKYIINGKIDVIPTMNNNSMMITNNDDDELKLILFGDHLKKLYPWLIWMGCDVICFLETDYKKLFEIALKQQRVIITINKKLVQRRNCPKYVLLSIGLKREEYAKQLIDRFNINILSPEEYDENIRNNLLCFQCKKILIDFDRLHDIDGSKLNQHELDKYKRSNDRIDVELEWKQCPECFQLSYYRNDGVLSVKLQDCIDNFKRYIKTLKTMEIEQEMKIKVFIFDHYLRELAQQLSWIGIDVKYIQCACLEYLKIFDIANKENRIIITGSKKIILRKNCPKYIIIDMNQTLNERRKYLFKCLNMKTMNLSLNDFHKYVLNNLWCWNCKGNLIKIKKEKLDKKLLTMNQLNKLNTNYNLIWYQCDECKQIQFHTGYITRRIQSWYKHITQLIIGNNTDNDNDNDNDNLLPLFGDKEIEEEKINNYLNITKIKLLLEYHFKSVAIWLQWIGIDAIYFKHKNAVKKYEKLFQIALKEKRIIVTTNDKIVMIKNCPQYILINNTSNKLKKNSPMLFKEILNHFKIDINFEDDKYKENISNFLVCFNCMEKLKKLSLSELNNLDTRKLKQNQIDILKNEINGYEWYKCIKCNYLKVHHTETWINGYYRDLKLAYFSPEKFYKIKIETKKQNDKEEKFDDKEEKFDDKEIIPFNDIVFPSLTQKKLYHPFKLKSVYSSFYGESPETTNFTQKFSGCLDYIFCSGLDNKNMEIINVDKIIKPNNFIPDEDFGSDHLPIKMHCKIHDK